MSYAGQAIVAILSLIPLVVFADLMASKKRSTLSEVGVLKKLYHAALFLLVSSGTAYLSHSMHKQGQGAWQAIYGPHKDAWVIDDAIGDYLSFLQVTLEAISTGIYHVTYIGLSKLPILDDIFSNDGYWGTEITLRVLLFIALAPLTTSLIVVCRRIVFEFQLLASNNQVIQEQLSDRYKETGWFSLEVTILTWVFSLVEIAMTIAAAIFFVKILAPLAVNSAAIAIASTGAFFLLRAAKNFWPAQRRATR